MPTEEGPDSTKQRWWLTATHGDVRDSATENRPPAASSEVRVRVKRWG